MKTKHSSLGHLMYVASAIPPHRCTGWRSSVNPTVRRAMDYGRPGALHPDITSGPAGRAQSRQAMRADRDACADAGSPGTLRARAEPGAIRGGRNNAVWMAPQQCVRTHAGQLFVVQSDGRFLLPRYRRSLFFFPPRCHLLPHISSL